MRWVWRLVVLFLVLGYFGTFATSQPKAFIAWQEGQDWSQVINTRMRQLQRFTQDLPASIEVEVRRLWNDFQANRGGKEV